MELRCGRIRVRTTVVDGVHRIEIELTDRELAGLEPDRVAALHRAIAALLLP